MGFYIRKSVKLGPLRLNFSKSGVGLSAGVRGFHLGLDARGRGYVSGGANGLYFREYAKQSHGRAEAGSKAEAAEQASPFAVLFGVIVIAVVVIVILNFISSRPGPASRIPVQSKALPAAMLYKVKPGDTLSKLSERFYHSTAEWEKIYQANRDVLRDPNRLRPGMDLSIPAEKRL